MRVPFWAKFILLLLVIRNLFKWCHTTINEYSGRPEKVCGFALEIGAQIYTVYYRLWFKPFEIRDRLMFDAFVDPWKGESIFVDPWNHCLTNPVNGNNIPLELAMKYTDTKNLLTELRRDK